MAKAGEAELNAHHPQVPAGIWRGSLGQGCSLGSASDFLTCTTKRGQVLGLCHMRAIAIRGAQQWCCSTSLRSALKQGWPHSGGGHGAAQDTQISWRRFATVLTLKNSGHSGAFGLAHVGRKKCRESVKLQERHMGLHSGCPQN